MDDLGERISDGLVLELIERYLGQEIFDDLKHWTPIQGTPQGAVLSPLLANLYLHPLDRLMNAEGHRIARYADDFVILCASEQEAQAALAKVRTWAEARGLRLHPDKTHLGDCRQRGQGFQFLGYRFEAGRRWVRKPSLKALKDKIRSKTGRSRGASLAQIVADLNPTLRGWFGYFKHAYRNEFPSIDGFVRRRLRAILRRHERRTGRLGKSLGDHRRWPNAFFAAYGLFTMTEAHALASQSR
jgi:RNA-directed DNA polymerase